MQKCITEIKKFLQIVKSGSAASAGFGFLLLPQVPTNIFDCEISEESHRGATHLIFHSELRRVGSQ